jgi:hypothetical protein
MRRRRAQLVLIIGLFTTLATSEAEDYRRRGELSLEELKQGDAAHFTVRASEVAHRQGEQFEIYVSVHNDYLGAAIHVVPDDVRVAPQDLWTWRIDAGIPSSIDAGAVEPTWAASGAYFYIELDQCPSTGECAVGFSVEVAELVSESAVIEVVAEMRRSADTAFLCASSRDFGPGASVEVERDD